MPTTVTSHQLPEFSETSGNMKRVWRRCILHAFLLLLSLTTYILLALVAPPTEGPPIPFLPVWALCFLPYFCGCAFVLLSKPLPGRWLWLEVGSILFGAFLFRLILFPLPPALSRDIWRYLWDARVIVHGYSPYVYPPDISLLKPLRNIVYENTRFRTITTDYPPGAELIFVLGYLLSPQNLLGVKGLFLLFDLITCGGITWLLLQRHLDPRRVIIYAWCPLPLVEFALGGHSDVIAVMFTVLAVACSQSSKPASRLFTGVLLGMATLARLYPLIVLPALIRRRDWLLLISCGSTIMLGYIPFLILGRGQVFGYFLTYAGEQGGNAGFLQLLVHDIGTQIHLNTSIIVFVEYWADVLFVAIVACIVLILRAKKWIQVEEAVLILISAVFAIASHIFPWYLPIFLPWVALLINPSPLPRKFLTTQSRKWLLWQGAIVFMWYNVCTALLSYMPSSLPQNATSDWLTSYTISDGSLIMQSSVVIVIALLYASVLFRFHRPKYQ